MTHPRPRAPRRVVKTAAWVSAALALASVVLLASARRMDGPWGMLPGGPFRGADEPCAAATWRELAAVEELQVEVFPKRPRSVTTWGVVHQGELFVPADFLTPFKRWPHLVTRDRRIRVRVRERIFRCSAERVIDTATLGVLRHAAAEKYGLEPDGLAAKSEVWWFQVAPR